MIAVKTLQDSLRGENIGLCDRVPRRAFDTYDCIEKSKVIPVLNLIKHYTMKAYWGVDV
jgi:hypothetical protein